MRFNIGLEEGLQEILNKVNVLSAETVPLMEALGRVVAEDIMVDILPESIQAAVTACLAARLVPDNSSFW